MAVRRSSNSGAGATAASAQGTSAAGPAPTRELDSFLNDLDPRALLWMFSHLEDRPLEQFVAVQVEQAVMVVMAAQAEAEAQVV